jgi:hypothetical protein
MSALAYENSGNSRTPMLLNNRACLVFSDPEHFVAEHYFELPAIKPQTEQFIILLPINQNTLLS